MEEHQYQTLQEHQIGFGWIGLWKSLAQPLLKPGRFHTSRAQFHYTHLLERQFK